uniref:Actin binding LIM protein family, member 3 n=1 Tax=Salarias fasciatus TaxID=181472 RepID=A0A672FWH0_SALFA
GDLSPRLNGSERSSGPIRCQRCREVCKGEVVRVQETHFHVKCFTCTVCNCDLARSGFFQKKGEYICTADYQRLYGTRCDRCDSFITGEVVSALGRTYHPKCFVCSVCRYETHSHVTHHPVYEDTGWRTGDRLWRQ